MRGFPGPQDCFSEGLRKIPGQASHENGPGTNEQGGRLAAVERLLARVPSLGPVHPY